MYLLTYLNSRKTEPIEPQLFEETKRWRFLFLFVLVYSDGEGVDDVIDYFTSRWDGPG